MVPGGNGHGRQYNAIMALLDKRFTVATYDRRQMSASKAKENKPLNPAQQARDIIAVIKALGYEKAYIFGNSAGAIFALQLAVSYPQYIEHLIAHEGPTLTILPEPEATELMDWFYTLLEIYKGQGMEAAFAQFNTKWRGMNDAGIPRAQPEPWNLTNFWENEVRYLSNYSPDIRKVVGNKVSVAVGVGKDSEGAFYANTVLAQKEIMGCPLVVFPGHHQTFENEPERFCPVLLETFDMLEKAKGGN